MFKRTALYAALVTAVGGMSPLPTPATAGPVPVVKTAEGAFSFVVIPPGIYSGGAAGLRLVHDYGAFQLWRVDAAHRNELMATASRQTRVQPTEVVFEAGALSANPDATNSVQVPEGFQLSKGSERHIQLVQFAGPLIEAWLDEVRASGAQLIQSVGGNGYLIYADQDSTSVLSRRVESTDHLLQVRAVEPFYKLSGELADKALNGFSGDSQLDVTVQIVKHGGNATTKAGITAFAQTGISGWSDRQVLESARLTVNVADIEKIAALGDVLAMEIRHPVQKFDEVQNQIIAGNFNGAQSGPSGPGYFAWLAGLGFSTDPADYPIVDVVDDGIGSVDDRTFHEDGLLASPTRLVSTFNCTGDANSTGPDGHGHLNLGVVGGFDDTAGFPWTDLNGYLRAQGVNPFTRIAHTKFFSNAGPANQSNCGNTDAGMIKSSQDRGAAITSNSWGAPVGGNYDDSSQAYDFGTRDGDTTEAGNQPMIHIFAAGNSGSGASTVGSPGTGKNMITVGASENFRSTDEDGNWTDGCAVGPTGANNAMDVIGFSSRGPVEGGRTKPEVIAPGTHIQASANTSPGYNGSGVCDQYRPGGQTVIAASSGTSHSTPAVAGVASLVWNWLDTEYGIAAPSAAMMKAYMMAHPTYLTGVGANSDLPSNSQGYGMPNMGDMFDATTARDLVDQTTTFDNPGETYTWTGSVVDNAKPLRIAIAWSDAFGAISDTTPQVNDLNLEVTVGGNTYLGNEFTGGFSSTGGSADTANNYEAVFLPAGVSGPMTVTVTAFAISGDGVPNTGDITDQDFAFVCNNCSAAPAFGIDATPTIAEVCSPLDAQWNVDVAALNGYAGNVALSTTGQPGGSTINFSVSPVAAPGMSTLTLGTGAVAAGDYGFDVVGNDGVDSHSDPVSLQLDDAIPAAPGLTMPADTATDVDTQPTFSWAAVPGAREYTLEVDDDPGFGSIDYTTTVSATTHSMPFSLAPVTTYYWRVRADNHCGVGADSSAFSFTTANLVCATFPGAGLPAPIGPGGGVITNSIATVSGLAGATITDVNVLGLRGTHTWDADLDVDLIAPDNTTVRVFDDICTDNDNFHINLDDSAGTAIGTVCPPGDPNGVAIDASPENPLSTLNAVDPDGDWTLRITDDAGGDGGQFAAWNLEICALVSTSAVVATDDTVTAIEDTQLNVGAPGVLGNDTGAGITASLTTPPANGTIVGGVVNADGSFSYMPAADDCGVAADSFTYTATDGMDSDSATVTIDITCTNDAPLADNDAYNANIGATLNVAAPGVLDGDTDIDGDPLTATNLVQPANGAVVLNADGSFSYTPDALYCNDGSPTDDFTYTANDGTVDSAPATVAMTVICDSLPTAVDDSITVAEGGTATMLDGGNTSVKQNDTDPEDTVPGGDVTLVTGPAFASAFTLNANGTFSYTHDDSENFSDSFTYTVADSSAQSSNEATVSINITPVADSPIISVTPANLSYAVDTGTTDSASLDIENVGGSTLDWELLDGPLAVDPSLDEAFVLGDFNLTNDGAPVEFIEPGGVASSGQVVGVRFQGTIAFNPGGTFSWASDTCMTVEGPNGESFVLGGFGGASQADCNTNAWLGEAAGAYDESFPNGFDPAADDAGNWTITFTNDWVSGSAATLQWTGVTVTLLKTLDAASCDPLSSVSWLSATPLSGSTGAGLTDSSSVDVDASGLAHGTYNATLCVASNDSAGNAVVEVPVQMDVAAPVIDLAPAALDFTVAPDATDSQDLTISNIGGLDLNWSIDEAAAPAVVFDRAGVSRFQPMPVTDALSRSPVDRVTQINTRLGKSSADLPMAKLVDTTLTQNVDGVTIEALNGVACPTGPNSFFRRYYFNEHPVVGNPVQINSLDIGIEAVPAAQAMTVNLYTVPGTDPVDTITLANLTLIGSTSVAISAADDNTIVNVPLLLTVADTVTNDLVVEVTVPQNLFLGGNVAGSTHPAFVMAAACGITTPETFSAIDFPDSNPIINVNAEDFCAAPSDITWLSVGTAAGTTVPTGSTLSSISVDSTGMSAGDYNANLCVNSNDVSTPLRVVPVSMTVTAANVAPVAVDDPGYAVNEGATLNGTTVKANDTDAEDGIPGGDVSIGTGPANASSFTLNPDGTFSYTHDGSETTTDSFTYTVMDNDGATSNVATATITIAPVDDGPADAVDDSATVAEDSGANVIDVLANDTADPDDSSLEVTAVGAASNGSTSFTAGNVSYTPAADYCGADSFTYTVNGGADTATVSVTVTCVDDGEADAVDDNATVAEDSGANVIDVLANDTADPDDSSLEVTAVGAASNGSTSFTAGNVSYTPDADYCGADSFTYTVNGGDTATVSIDVTCVDDGPAVANDDSANVVQNSTANLIDVLANDVADPDDGSLNLTAVGAPGNGTAVIDAGQISYTPTAGYCGPDSFTYEVNGGITATVTVSVACLAPAIFADGFED